MRIRLQQKMFLAQPHSSRRAGLENAIVIVQKKVCPKMDGNSCNRFNSVLAIHHASIPAQFQFFVYADCNANIALCNEQETLIGTSDG
jgi:hypothetical protein